MKLTYLDERYSRSREDLSVLHDVASISSDEKYLYVKYLYDSNNTKLDLSECKKFSLEEE
jgi:hypothetical protein